MLDTAHLHADRCVELERASAGGDLRIAVDDADLLTQLVDEDGNTVGFGDDAGELSHRLAHHAGVQADKRVAHLALDLRARNQCGNRVDDDQIDRTRAHQLLGDLQSLIAGVRLRDQQAVHIDAERLGIGRVERVLRVDIGDLAAHRLRLCHRVQCERRLTGGLRSVDLDNSSARQAADSERHIQTDRTGRDDADVHRALLSHAHDGVFAELLFNLRQSDLQRLLFVGGNGHRLNILLFLSHGYAPYHCSNPTGRGRAPRARCRSDPFQFQYPSVRRCGTAPSHRAPAASRTRPEYTRRD